MGIFKELLRDIAERNLSQREIYIKRAQDAEAEKDWSNAESWYEQAEEWEKAGDMCVKKWKTKDAAYPEYSLIDAAKHYCTARRFTKLRNAYEEYVCVFHGSLGKDHVQMLIETGQLEDFIKNVAASEPGSGISSEKKRGALHSLLYVLFEVQAFSPAADIFLRFPETFSYHGKEVIPGLLRQGDIRRAAEIGSLVAKQKLLHVLDYGKFAKMFVEAKAYEAAKEMLRILFSSEPLQAVKAAAETFRDTDIYRGFLSYALKQDPMKLGDSLRYLDSISSPERHPGGELEADFLLQCYEAVGPQSLDNNKEGTTWWLYSLAKFWKARGDKAREAELQYRLVEDQKRLGIVDRYFYPAVEGFSGHGYARAAWAFADTQEFSRAAEAMEKAALADYSVPREHPDRGFWYQGAKLYEKAGNREKAAELYDQCGQSAKASRLRGTTRYDAKEAGTVVEALNVPGDSKDWILKKAEELASGRPAEDAAGSLLQELENEKGGMWEDWLVVPVLYKRSKDTGAYTETLRKIELKFRNRGRWVFAAKIFLFQELYDEFDRVCIEEDETEVAALWYEQAKIPDRAAKIYDLMGESGKSSKAQSEGAKQKPKDTAEPKSESAEAVKGENFDQLACPQCGAVLKLHWTVCPKCDAVLKQRACRNCGEPLAPDWKKCPVCLTGISP